MTPEEFVKEAKVTELGGDWGDLLWRLETKDRSIDVHASSADEARQKVLEHLQDS